MTKSKKVVVELVGGPFDGATRKVVVRSDHNTLRYVMGDPENRSIGHAYGGVLEAVSGAIDRLEYLGPELEAAR